MPVNLVNHLASGKHMPGILILRPKTTVKVILEDLILIAELSNTDEFRDQIVHIPL